MWSLIYFVLIIFISGYLRICQGQCPTQESFIIQNGIKTKITWPSTKFGTVTSNPPCIDKSKKLITRICSDNEWNPIEVPTCESFQNQFVPSCLENHISYKDICISISEPQVWTSEFPITDVLDITKYEYLELLFQQYNISQMWLPVKRTEKYGKFVWTLPNSTREKYRNELLNYNLNPTFPLYDCVIINEIFTVNKEIVYNVKTEDCNAKHRMVYIYHPKSIYAVETTNFTYSTFNNNAYFITSYENGKYDCNKLAEPKTKEDNFVVKTLVGNRSCRIGIEKDNNEMYIWSSSNEIINYTDWNFNLSTDFNKISVVVNRRGWSLENEENISCAVCQVDQSKYKIDLMLQPNINNTQLILTAYSAKRINSIVCKTIGLEDIDLQFNITEVKVNNFYQSGNPLEKLNTRSVWILNILNSNFNYYQCFGKILPQGIDIKTEQVFFSKNLTGREYAFELQIFNYCKKSICDPHLDKYYKNISRWLKNNLNDNIIERYRTIKILNIEPKNGDIQILCHLHTTGTIQNITTEFNLVKRLIDVINRKQLLFNSYRINIREKSLKSCIGCLMSSTTIMDNKHVKWDFTYIGKKASPIKICSQKKCELYTRKCGGNFLHGSKWQTPEKVFQKDIQYSNITNKLQKLYSKQLPLTPVEIISTLQNLTIKTNDLNSIDVFFVSKIIQNVSQTEIIYKDSKSLARNMSKTINNLIACNISSLEESNQALNSTNVLLDSVEKLMQKATSENLDETGVNKIVEDNYLCYTSDPFISGITGLALIRPNSYEESSFSKYFIKKLFANMSVDDVISLENLETAIYIPELLLKDIQNKSQNNPVRISIMLFYNDSLFVENENKTQLASRVFDVSITGYENYLFSAFPVITKLKVNSSEGLCAYWDFGRQINNGSTSSRWKIDNDMDTVFIPEKNLQICHFKHLTNFAMLLGKQVSYSISSDSTFNTSDLSISEEENYILEILTGSGCVLSTIGICGIFLTAMIFKSWRHKIGSKVLLNVSACIQMQIIILYLNLKHNKTICIITGALLHYSILCGFSWALIMAVLQYLRFVRVIGGPTSHLLLKTSIVGWLLPIIPVIVILITDLNNYIPSMDKMGLNICYPQGILLYATVLLPIALIVVANLIIFCLIIYKITWKPKIRQVTNDKQLSMQQFKLAVLLFFLLGLTWISGLLTVVFHSIECLYIFCATATLQGFILFLFYVVLDQGTRKMWVEMFSMLSKPAKKTSQQSNQPTGESNAFNTKENTPECKTHVQDGMQERDLNGTHRIYARSRVTN